MSKTKIGVIGNGFVGEAISFAFSSIADMYIYDTDPLRSLNDVESLFNSEEFLISLSSESSLIVCEEFSFICYIADYLR